LKDRHISTLTQPEDLLRRVQVASPCAADWGQMIGDDRVRQCPECNLNVYNLSAMTVREAAQLVSSHQGRLCVRYYRRADGTVLTQDCPRGARTSVHRASRIAGAALTAAMTVTFAAAQATPYGSQSLVQIDRNESGIVVHVADASGAVFPNAHVILLNQASQKELKGITDSSGSLHLLHLPAGSFRITVSGPGFEQQSQIVAVQEQQITTLNVTLPIQTLIQGAMAYVPPMPLVVVDSVPIPLEPILTVEQAAVSKKPLVKRMFSGAWRRLGF